MPVNRRSPLRSSYPEPLLAEMGEFSGPGPGHVALIFDHAASWVDSGIFDHFVKVLHWCEGAGVAVVSAWFDPAQPDSSCRADLSDRAKALTSAINELATSSRWKIRHIGRSTSLSAPVREAVEIATRATNQNSGPTLNLALGYDGQQDVVDALASLALAASRSGVTLGDFLDELSVDDLAAHLSTAGQSDPDLVIRTSGSRSLSGFLLWQAAHSEFYFTGNSWLDFDETEFKYALAEFASTERRFGR